MTSEIFGTDSLRNIAKNCLPEYEARFVLYAADKIDALRAENERLKGVIADYRQDIARVLDEQCPTDERHCGCVPILRAEVERLRGALDTYADKRNWARVNSKDYDWFQEDGNGFTIAREALKGGEG